MGIRIDKGVTSRRVRPQQFCGATSAGMLAMPGADRQLAMLVGRLRQLTGTTRWAQPPLSAFGIIETVITVAVGSAIAAFAISRLGGSEPPQLDACHTPKQLREAAMTHLVRGEMDLAVTTLEQEIAIYQSRQQAFDDTVRDCKNAFALAYADRKTTAEHLTTRADEHVGWRNQRDAECAFGQFLLSRELNAKQVAAQPRLERVAAYASHTHEFWTSHACPAIRAELKWYGVKNYWALRSLRRRDFPHTVGRDTYISAAEATTYVMDRVVQLTGKERIAAARATVEMNVEALVEHQTHLRAGQRQLMDAYALLYFVSNLAGGHPGERENRMVYAHYEWARLFYDRAVNDVLLREHPAIVTELAQAHAHGDRPYCERGHLHEHVAVLLSPDERMSGYVGIALDCTRVEAPEFVNAIEKRVVARALDAVVAPAGHSPDSYDAVAGYIEPQPFGEPQAHTLVPEE